MKSKIIRVYIDGAYSRQRNRGAAAFVVTSYDYTVLYEGGDAYIKTTSNRMELWAAINSLEWCERNAPKLRPVIYTDSKYLNRMQFWIPHWQRCGWVTRRGVPIANIDLVLMLGLRLLDSPHNITSYWVKGHSGDKWNERAHDIAEALSVADSPARDDLGGMPLLTTSDILRICHSTHVNNVIQYSYRVTADMSAGGVP